MPLLDQHAGMMDRLGHSRLKHKSLQTSLQEVLHSERQHVIELGLALIQKTVPVHASQKSLPLKNTSRVLLIESQQHTRVVADTAQRVLHPPELTLVTQTILSYELQLRVKPLLLERPARLLERLPIYIINESINPHKEHLSTTLSAHIK
jgi:hypothetical protein